MKLHPNLYVVLKQFDPLLMEDGIPFSSKEYRRSINCLVLADQNQCMECNDKYIKTASSAQNKKMSQPAKLEAPISATSTHRVLLSLREHRLKNKQLEEKLEEMQQEITRSSVEVDPELKGDFLEILNNASDNMTPFLQLFWQEQKKLSSKIKLWSKIPSNDNQFLFISLPKICFKL